MNDTRCPGSGSGDATCRTGSTDGALGIAKSLCDGRYYCNFPSASPPLDTVCAGLSPYTDIDFKCAGQAGDTDEIAIECQIRLKYVCWYFHYYRSDNCEGQLCCLVFHKFSLWYGEVSFIQSQRAHNVIITSLLRQNDVAASFWLNNDVIITLCVRWDLEFDDIVCETAPCMICRPQNRCWFNVLFNML